MNIISILKNINKNRVETISTSNWQDGYKLTLGVDSCHVIIDKDVPRYTDSRGDERDSKIKLLLPSHNSIKIGKTIVISIENRLQEYTSISQMPPMVQFHQKVDGCASIITGSHYRSPRNLLQNESPTNTKFFIFKWLGVNLGWGYICAYTDIKYISDPTVDFEENRFPE